MTVHCQFIALCNLSPCLGFGGSYNVDAHGWDGLEGTQGINDIESGSKGIQFWSMFQSIKVKNKERCRWRSEPPINTLYHRPHGCMWLTHSESPHHLFALNGVILCRQLLLGGTHQRPIHIILCSVQICLPPGPCLKIWKWVNELYRTGASLNSPP